MSKVGEKKDILKEQVFKVKFCIKRNVKIRTVILSGEKKTNKIFKKGVYIEGKRNRCVRFINFCLFIPCSTDVQMNNVTHVKCLGY